LLREYIDEKQITELVNCADFCGETPMRTLEEGCGRTELSDEESIKRKRIYLALITFGADSCTNSNREGNEGSN
jgi:hypothetical protein